MLADVLVREDEILKDDHKKSGKHFKDWSVTQVRR
jgi:hypothetical protein